MLGSIALASEDSYLLDILSKKAARARSADQYEIDPWLRENNLFRTFIFDKQTGKFASVLLERSADGKKLSLGNQLDGGPEPGNQIDTVYRAYLTNPDILLAVVKRKSISDQSFLQIRLSDGKQVNLYKPPPQGLPPAIDGISAYAVEDKMVLIFSYEDEKSSETLETAPRYVIGVWPRQGGECLKGWVGPPDDVARIIYVEPVGGKDIAYLMSLRTDGHRDITRLGDDKTITVGSLPFDDLPPVYVTPAAFASQRVLEQSLETWSKITQRILLGGNDYWNQLTAIELPEEQKKRLTVIQEHFDRRHRKK
jgi:hypothetical protein